MSSAPAVQPSPLAAAQAANEASQRRIDFRMVTFTLAGKDYGIDIMKVKEISRGASFTYVPNTAEFVVGVHNLRGDIVPIVDLRVMFRQPVASTREHIADSLIMLQLQSMVVGVVVDDIVGVVGLDSASVQPPHPLFSDVNLKYLYGVVEESDRLYVILDVERIFGEEDTAASVAQADAMGALAGTAAAAQREAVAAAAADAASGQRATTPPATARVGAVSSPPSTTPAAPSPTPEHGAPLPTPEPAEQPIPGAEPALAPTGPLAQDPVAAPDTPTATEQAAPPAASPADAPATTQAPAAAGATLAQAETAAAQPTSAPPTIPAADPPASTEAAGAASEAASTAAESPAAEQASPPPATASSANLETFVREGLATFASFHVTELNEHWLQERLASWSAERSREGMSPQLESKADALAFLEPFPSPYSGQLWAGEHIAALEALAAERSGDGMLHMLDAGCGRGHEAYSIAAAARSAHPNRQLRVWAHDNDLISVTSAPTLLLAPDQVPDYYRSKKLVEETPHGVRLAAAVRDSLVFEFHDLRSLDDFPPLDLVVIRDTLSLYEQDTVDKLLMYYHEQLKEDGLLLLGSNERATGPLWREHAAGPLTCYRKAE